MSVPPAAHTPSTQSTQSQDPGDRRSARAPLRSLRVQVLLWTALPLTILLIAFSLTGVGRHQASMRSLAGEEAQRLSNAVATGLAQQLASYQVGLEAAARLVHHHFDDGAMRDFHLAETSAVLGGVNLVLLDTYGTPVASTIAPPPAWANQTNVPAAGQSVGRMGDLVLVRTEVPGKRVAIVAAVPFTSFTFALYVDPAHKHLGTDLVLIDGDGASLLSASDAVTGDPGQAATHAATTAGSDQVTALAPVAGTPWTVLLRESWHTRTAPLIRIEQAMPFVLLVAAAVSFLTLFFGLHLVVQPLRALATSAQRIGGGDFGAASTPVGGVDEIENVRQAMDQMAMQIRDHQRALEQYLLAITRAQEDERARLARELHDETVQGLIALDHRLQKAQRTLQREPTALRDEIAELRQMARQAMDEVRRFSRALRPAYLEDLGLCPALEMLCNELDVEFTMMGTQRRLDPTMELALYRIAQESINNARRHAQAQRISLLLDCAPIALTLRVTDNGTGFAPPPQLATLSRDGHFGLLGIQERADLIGAKLTIDSAPGRGTRITVHLPT
ncbi:MAG: HAMP domain-containing sensor histidine kinase [Caldilineaceae bacterium]